MSGDHGHFHGRSRREPATSGRWAIALALLALFMVAELVIGLTTGSLALLSDAGHMFSDVLGIAMALAAIRLASRGRQRSHRTFGLYRLEVLAALANAVLLFGGATWVLVEAVSRFGDPAEVATTPMLVVAVGGLAANLVAFALCARARRNR